MMQKDNTDKQQKGSQALNYIRTGCNQVGIHTAGNEWTYIIEEFSI